MDKMFVRDTFMGEQIDLHVAKDDCHGGCYYCSLSSRLPRCLIPQCRIGGIFIEAHLEIPHWHMLKYSEIQ